MTNEWKEVCEQYGVTGGLCTFGNGHINSTFLVKESPFRILQRINATVFRNPVAVMENIGAVTAHLRDKIKADGGDPERETLTLVPTLDGKPYYIASSGDLYRMYLYIDGTVSLDQADSPEVFAASAHAFGKFQRMLGDFPAHTLNEVIPHFHDTVDRLRLFREALEKDTVGRAKDAELEIRFVLDRAAYVSRVTDAIAEGSVPLRVTHNDTKLNNVMVDADTHAPVCVIDLDTVMPGSMLYDFGDALRFGASTGSEDEVDLSKIEFDLAYFEAFTKAFLEEVGESITPRERELLAFSALLMTLECGMRFLTDYLNGDVYFRTYYPQHNLDRCRTQFKLVADMEQKMQQMERIVASASN